MKNLPFLKLPLFAIAVAILSAGCTTTDENPDAAAFDGADDTLNPGGWEEGFGPGDSAYPETSFETLPPVATPPGVYPVYFRYNESSIPAEESSKVGTVARFLADNPGVVVLLEGNCDERGTNEYNLSLGEYRAQAVRERLAAAGVSAERVQTVSYGEEKPAAFGHDEASWAQNRRAEFGFFKAKGN